jgi:hypothetical protein
MDEKNLGSFVANLPDDPGDQRERRKNVTRIQMPRVIKRIHSFSGGLRFGVPCKGTVKLGIGVRREPVHLGAKGTFLYHLLENPGVQLNFGV